MIVTHCITHPHTPSILITGIRHVLALSSFSCFRHLHRHLVMAIAFCYRIQIQRIVFIPSLPGMLTTDKEYKNSTGGPIALQGGRLLK